jgi:soluble lytic murein transglycosylase
MWSFKKTVPTTAFACITLFFAARCLSVASDIYMSFDENGIVHFTNTPTSSDEKIFFKETVDSDQSVNMSDRYDELIQKAANQYNIAFQLLKALIKVESDFNPLAVSPAGAKGLMQIMPENMDDLGIKNVFDPAENIMGGTRYLRALLEKFDKNIPLALAAYNAGPNVVRRYGSIPPFNETEMFVNSVMTYYHALKIKKR